MRAGSVPVSFFVSSNRKLGNVSTHGVFGEIEFHVGAALAALTVIDELERVGVGHEIRRQEKSSGEFALAAEIPLGARIETIKKSIVAVKNVIGIVKQIHHEAAVSNGKIARRVAAAGVEMLIIGIERHRKHTSSSPFKRVLLSVALPNAR